MNIKEIQQIVNSKVRDDIKEILLIKSLSKDKNVITNILKILDEERTAKSELISNMNLELSRAHIYIDLNKEIIDKKDKNTFTKSFVLEKITEFYIKYKTTVTHCFNKFN